MDAPLAQKFGHDAGMAQVHAKDDALLRDACRTKALLNDVCHDCVPRRNAQATLEIGGRIVLAIEPDFGQIQIRLDAKRSDWRQQAFLDGGLQRESRLMVAEDLCQRLQVGSVGRGSEANERGGVEMFEHGLEARSHGVVCFIHDHVAKRIRCIVLEMADHVLVGLDHEAAFRQRSLIVGPVPQPRNAKSQTFDGLIPEFRSWEP